MSADTPNPADAGPPPMLEVPAGSGAHPILLVAISANRLEESRAFYSKLFGWTTHPLTAELVASITPEGPGVALRAGVPEGFQGAVPFIVVPNVLAALTDVQDAGATIEKSPWNAPLAGMMARFADPSGTLYGLTDALTVGGAPPRLKAPFGGNPKPAPGTVCAVEMYAKDGAAAARFFGELFGWGARETMPQYVGFDPGAGVTGTFQSHTPALPGVAYIYVADVAAKIAEIEAAGGKRVGDPMAVPGMATFSYFIDPSGTTMGLIGP
jgi:hypothetical protein